MSRIGLSHYRSNAGVLELDPVILTPVPTGKFLVRSRLKATLSQLQPFQLNAIAADLREFVLSLLHHPAVFSASEHLGQPHGHFGRYAALPVYQFRKRIPRNAKGLGGFRNRQAQRLDALAQHNASGVWWIFHGHGLVPFSGNRHNQPRRAEREARFLRNT